MIYINRPKVFTFNLAVTKKIFVF